MRISLSLAHTLLCLILLCAALLCSTASAEDLPGSSDPVGIKRYQGSSIVRYEKIAFDAFHLPLGKMTKFDFGTKAAEFEKSEKIEGQITRVSYRVPDPTRSSLEVFRNYEAELRNAGWEIPWKASGKAEFGNSFSHLYSLLSDNDQLFTYSDAQAHTLTAKKPAEGLFAMLYVTKYEHGLTRGIQVDKGDPLIQLDVIQTKKMEEKMVFVQASEMEKSISENGRIALYGIQFDFNKADLRPESELTVAEIAKLLQQNSSLKVVVTGHTDSVGDFEQNRELSERRAAAVVSTLVQKHGIDSGRLKAFGASYAAPLASNTTDEGRAKNRRVEIVGLPNTGA